MYESPAIIAQVGALLREALPTSQAALKAHILAVEALRYDLACKTTEWLVLLHEKRGQYLWPKDKDVTELDRKVRVDADTALIEGDYQLLQKIEALVFDRLELAKRLIQGS